MISPSETVDAPPLTVPAAYFDGKQSVRHYVELGIAGGELRIDGAGVAIRLPLAAVEICEPLGTTPRVIRLGGGAFCSVEHHAEFGRLLASQGILPTRVSQWEGNLRWVVVAAIAFVAILIGSYRYGLPVAADVIACRVPSGVVDSVSEQALATFDDGILGDTTVTEERQASIRNRFLRLTLPETPTTEYEVLFRDSALFGANALALPSGTLIVTDGLVALSDDDTDIVAVLAHEAGHVEQRHSLRQLFQNSAVALGVTWFIGDASFLAALAPTALLQAKYSRDFEREADAYAIQVLDANGIPREHFASMLEALERSAGGESGDAGNGAVMSYLSSHPVTRERLETVRRK